MMPKRKIKKMLSSFTVTAIIALLVITLLFPIGSAATESDPVTADLKLEKVNADPGPYYLGDIIHYNMKVTNPGVCTYTLKRVWDVYPDGYVEDFISGDVTLGPGEALVLSPTYEYHAHEVGPVVNQLFAKYTLVCDDGSGSGTQIVELENEILPRPTPTPTPTATPLAKEESALRIYGEDCENAAFPYTDPEAPFALENDEAPPKDFVTFNPAAMTGIIVNNVDSKEKVFLRQWFVPWCYEPFGRVWLDDPNKYGSEDIINEYTYMLVDKHYNPVEGTAMSPSDALWTRFWFPVADNDDNQIGLDGYDIDGDSSDDMVLLRGVGDFDRDSRKDIAISSPTYELEEGDELQFLDHKIVVKNVAVISGVTPLVNLVVDIYYTGNDEPELIEQNFMAQVVPGGYVSAGRHAAINGAPNFYNPWFLQVTATGADRTYVQVGRLLHTGETFFVDAAEYDIAMIFGSEDDSIKYITIRNPIPEDNDVNLKDLSVIKKSVDDNENLPMLPPFNRKHTMVDDINIPHYSHTPGLHPDDTAIDSRFDTVEKRLIPDVDPLNIYFTGKDTEPRYNTDLLEILDEIQGTTTEPVDILFEIDLTGSMGDELDQVKASSVAIMNAIRASVPDSQFGLVTFMDYNGRYDYCDYAATYGSTGDYPYSLDQPITSDIGAVATAISATYLGYGEDMPEDYTRVLYEAGNDPAIGWRPGATRIVVIFGDAPTHDCDFYGAGNSTGCDPGRDATAGTGDDLDFETVVADLASQGIIVLAIDSSASPSPNDPVSAEAISGAEEIIPYDAAEMSFRYMAEETGGAYRKLTDAGDIPDVIVDLVSSVLPVEEKWQWLEVHTMPDLYKEFVYPPLPDIDGRYGDYIVTLSFRAPNAGDERVKFVYDQEVNARDIYVNNYTDYNTLRLYGEDGLSAAFPYSDPEAPFDPLNPEAPTKDFVTLNPAEQDGIIVSNVDSKMKIFMRQWFVPWYKEPTGRVWIDEPNEYYWEDVVSEYTYMFVDKHFEPTAGTPLSPSGAYWTRFWFPVADNDDSQIGLDGYDVNGDSADDTTILRAVGDFDGDGLKDISISSPTFELHEGDELQFLDHKIVVKNVEVLSGTPPLISLVVDIYYTGNDVPELIEENFMAQIVPGEFVSAGRHAAINAAPDFENPWYLKGIATGDNRAYVVVGRLLHTGETFFVDAAEYDIAMIHGPTDDSLKYITIRNPVPEHKDVNLEDLSVIKKSVDNGEILPVMPPFNRMHTMVDDINIPKYYDGYCPTYYPDNDGIYSPFDTVAGRLIPNVDPMEIYFVEKGIEPRFHTNLLEMLWVDGEYDLEGWNWRHIHTMPDFYKEFVYPELPDIDGGTGDYLVTSSFTAPNSCGKRVMFAYDATDGTGLYINERSRIEPLVDWNPWDDDCEIDNAEMSMAVYYWKSMTPINGHVITNAEISMIVYEWKTGDIPGC